jgi:hypothetical protein
MVSRSTIESPAVRARPTGAGVGDLADAMMQEFKRVVAERNRQ